MILAIKTDLPLKAAQGGLATRMAGLARLVRDLIQQTFKAGETAGELHAQLKARLRYRPISR